MPLDSSERPREYLNRSGAPSRLRASNRTPIPARREGPIPESLRTCQSTGREPGDLWMSADWRPRLAHEIVAAMEGKYGQAQRIWVMDGSMVGERRECAKTSPLPSLHRRLDKAGFLDGLSL